MGRRGNKRRGQKAGVGKGAELIVAMPDEKCSVKRNSAVAMAGTPLSSNELRAAPMDMLESMPWNRWKHGSLPDPKKEHAELAHWKEHAFGNPAFEKYYVKQGIITQGELPLLLKSLGKPLPVTFRLNPTHIEMENLMRRFRTGAIGSLAKARPQLRQWKWRGQKLEFLLRHIPSLPKNLVAWELGLDRAGLKIGQKKHPELREILGMLLKGTEIGALSRQEIVSMLSVAILDARPGDKALDMCAAPGSKTSQLLEAVRPNTCTGKECNVSGVVVANDAGVAERLPQLQRVLGSRPLREQAGLLLTGGMGEQLPLLQGNGSALSDGYFDKVLADVPCSGDGTVRKAPDVLRRWTPKPALQLHLVQVDLALHGLRLLRVGGTMVYSTCSLNPIEDEAVIASVLRQAAGAVVLRDMSERLGGLKLRSGLSSWHVGDMVSSHSGQTMRWYSTAEVAVKAGMQGVTSGLWPPTPAELDWMELHHCRRVLPQDNDTGGFFLALLEKKKPLPETSLATPAPHNFGDFSPATNKLKFSLCRAVPGLQRKSLRRRIWVSGQGVVSMGPPEVATFLTAGWPVIKVGAQITDSAKCLALKPEACKLLETFVRSVDTNVGLAPRNKKVACKRKRKVCNPDEQLERQSAVVADSSREMPLRKKRKR